MHVSILQLALKKFAMLQKCVMLEIPYLKTIECELNGENNCIYKDAMPWYR